MGTDSQTEIDAQKTFDWSRFNPESIHGSKDVILNKSLIVMSDEARVIRPVTGRTYAKLFTHFPPGTSYFDIVFKNAAVKLPNYSKNACFIHGYKESLTNFMHLDDFINHSTYENKQFVIEKILENGLNNKTHVLIQTVGINNTSDLTSVLPLKVKTYRLGKGPDLENKYIFSQNSYPVRAID